MRHFQSKNLSIHYRVSGYGDPVIFLHGFLENHCMWDGIYPSIEEMDKQIIRIDLPCHGESRFSGDICEMKTMAETVAELINELQLINPTIIGHSMGGYVGLELAKLVPVELILVHSNFWDDSVEKKKDRDRVAKIVALNKNRLIQEAIPNLFAPINRLKCQTDIQVLMENASKIPANEIIAATMGMRNRLSNQNILKTTKTSIIQGDSDPTISTEMLFKNTTNYLSREQIYIIENSGHMSIWEQSENLIKLLKLILFK